MTIPKIAQYPLPSLGTWPAARAQWRLDAQRSALLVHDMQHYFLEAFEPGVSPVAPMTQNIQRLCALARRAGVPVLFSAQPGEQTQAERGLLWDVWGPGIVRSPEKRSILSGLRNEPADVLIEKRRYSAFYETELAAVLSAGSRDQLVITGIYAHIGCHATALDGFMRGVKPFVVADATADFSERDHHNALHQVARTCGVVTTTEEVATALALEIVRHHVDQVLDAPGNEVQPEDDLGDHGVDSIRLMQLHERLLGADRTLDFETLIEARSVRRLAQLLLAT
jgi:bifunctional isochorismate lyase / aryl carrier protein